MIYLDANATEIIRPEARAATVAALDMSGNPSSIHGPGRAARKIVEQARLAIASEVKADVGDVIFTSGGTEANCLAISALSVGRRVALGATEHDAVRMAAPGADILPVEAGGRICLQALERFLSRDRPALICLMLANNETGVLHPIASAASLCRAHGALLHVDAVQGLGRMPVNLVDLGAHSLALSGHKAGGPKGAGALALARGMAITPLISGGGQEQGRRGGTPDLAALAGFGAAMGLSQGPSLLTALRDGLEAAAVACGAIVCGHGPRLANTSCLALPGIAALVQVISLDLAGFAVSAGSACSSGKVSRSRVLDAMGLGALADCAIRVSLPWNATAEDTAAFGVAYAAMACRLGRKR